jgi:hypothetical protein
VISDEGGNRNSPKDESQKDLFDIRAMSFSPNDLIW